MPAGNQRLGEASATDLLHFPTVPQPASPDLLPPPQQPPSVPAPFTLTDLLALSSPETPVKGAVKLTAFPYLMPAQ